MNSVAADAKSPPALLKRYRVLNSVGRRLFASFDSEEEASSFIMGRPEPSCRFAIEDVRDPAPPPYVEQIGAEARPSGDAARASSRSPGTVSGSKTGRTDRRRSRI